METEAVRRDRFTILGDRSASEVSPIVVSSSATVVSPPDSEPQPAPRSDAAIPPSWLKGPVGRLTLWVARFGHNAALQRLMVTVAPLASSRLFPLLSGLLAFIATLSLTIPVVPVLTALVVMNRARWRSITLWAVLGSASGGALFTHLLGHFGTAFLQARVPQLVASSHWQHTVDWVAQYGMVTLAAIAALPVAQSPALLLAAILGMPWYHVFGALLIGKAVKYGLMAAITAGTVGHLAVFYGDVASGLVGHRRPRGPSSCREED